MGELRTAPLHQADMKGWSPFMAPMSKGVSRSQVSKVSWWQICFSDRLMRWKVEEQLSKSAPMADKLGYKLRSAQGLKVKSKSGGAFTTVPLPLPPSCCGHEPQKDYHTADACIQRCMYKMQKTGADIAQNIPIPFDSLSYLLVRVPICLSLAWISQSLNRGREIAASRPTIPRPARSGKRMKWRCQCIVGGWDPVLSRETGDEVAWALCLGLCEIGLCVSPSCGQGPFH